MLQEMIITGAKSSSGEYEGRSYDSTKIYVQTKMNDQSGEMVGFATSEYNWGDSSNFNKLKDLEFPIKAKVEMDIVTSGKNSKMVVTDVQPVVASVTAKPN
ncbi:hypothetical protein [Psychrobacter sp.]|uniref:hypothetical protein n=1 Tax=Psychrobacter sp. TaxID=56811 RepID=UPI003C73FF99